MAEWVQRKVGGVTFTEFIPAAGSQLPERVKAIEPSGCSRALCCSYVCHPCPLRLQHHYRWFITDPYHQQDSSSHGWQHHHALLQRRHLPDLHGGAGGHVQAHPDRNLTGDQPVSLEEGEEEWWFTRWLWTPCEFFFFFNSLVRGIRKAMRRCLDWFEVFRITWNVVRAGCAWCCYTSAAVWAEVFLIWFFFNYFLKKERDSSLRHAVALII